jgi:D-serine deaminase-like pyridoxal phosphate-dependent protein
VTLVGQPPLAHAGWMYKAFPAAATADVAALGWNLLAGDLATPVLILKEAALDNNIGVMSDYCRARGVSLAPHGKTYMSPEITRRQLEAGAWAVTAATASQVRVFRAMGADRILMANQLLDPAGLEWIAAELDADPTLEFLCLVDSHEGVALMTELLQAAAPARPLRVLVELGFEGGRTGCRTVEKALAVAHAVARSPVLEIAGVEGYEGIMDLGDPEATAPAVEAFMRSLRDLVVRLGSDGSFDHLEEVVVSAGGSAYFDVVTDVLGARWDLDRPVRVVLRGGCYATHDSGMYKRLSPFDGRGPGGPKLQHALELWSTVTSRPEAGLALANFGKRDVSHDVEMPIPLAVWHRATGVVGEASGVQVSALNDQHAYLRVEPGIDLAVGDMLCCGISHPCTSFDKWRLIPLVDDCYTVTGAVQTFF